MPAVFSPFSGQIKDIGRCRFVPTETVKFAAVLEYPVCRAMSVRLIGIDIGADEFLWFGRGCSVFLSDFQSFAFLTLRRRQDNCSCGVSGRNLPYRGQYFMNAIKNQYFFILQYLVVFLFTFSGFSDNFLMNG